MGEKFTRGLTLRLASGIWRPKLDSLLVIPAQAGSQSAFS